MTLYHCSIDTSHPPTDQGWLVGCRACRLDQYSASSAFFTAKHLPGAPSNDYVSSFTYDPSTHSLTFIGQQGRIVLDSPIAFIDHWLDPSRAELLWNSRHSSPNILVREAGYGATGSGTTFLGALSSELTGLQVARALSAEAHAYPVNPGHVKSDLAAWPWRCACSSLAPQGARACLACSAEPRR